MKDFVIKNNLSIDFNSMYLIFYFNMANIIDLKESMTLIDKVRELHF